MSNVLNYEKQQQVLSLGRLGWTLRRIEQATDIRRETASGYLKAAGIAVRGRGRPGTRPPKLAISTEVSTDPPKSPVAPRPGRAPTASACEPYRELIVEAVGRGRNAMAIWQDLVDDHGFPARYASVRRFVVSLRGRRVRRAWSLPRRPARKARSTMAPARWSAIRRAGGTDGPGGVRTSGNGDVPLTVEN